MTFTSTMSARPRSLIWTDWLGDFGHTKMKPHQERVVTEKTELDDKRTKLIAFIRSDTYRTLEEAEQSRLHRQLEAMTLYSNILSERIAAFA